jgi:ATP-dependent helicase YprA (DUF1998 family)
MPNKDFINSEFYKNQVMYINPKAEIPENFTNDPQINDFFNGFVHGDVLIQLRDTCDLVINRDKPFTVLELPPYAGKTTAAFASAFIKSYNSGRNSLIVYPSEVKRKIASSFIQKKLKEIYYHEFPSFKELAGNDTINSEDILKPGIYITDINSLHSNILPNVNYPLFWQQMGFVALEDIDGYKNEFGSNTAYVFRRLFAKLTKYDADYSILCTKNPFTCDWEDIKNLTGITDNEISYVNSNSKGKPAFEIMHWYPHVKSIDKQNTGNVEITYEDYYNELTTLLAGLMRENRRVAVLWERFMISEEDIANIVTTVSELQRNEISSLFIGNTLEEIRYKLLNDSKELDFQDIDVFIIPGSKKPVSEYLLDFRHLGSPNHLIIIYNHQTPSLQYHAHRQINRSKQIPSDLSIKSLNINLKDTNIIKNHITFLKEEYPDISVQVLKKCSFPEKFRSLFLQEEPFSHEYLFLNKNIRFLPKIKRYREQLLQSAKSSLFSVFEVKKGIREEIGKLNDYTVRAYCYPQAMFVFGKYPGQPKTSYKIKTVDYQSKEILVEKMSADKTVTYKISNYDIEENAGEHSDYFDSLTVFNGNLTIEKKYCNVTETIHGIRQTNNFHEYHQNDFADAVTSFENITLPVIELKINMNAVSNFYINERGEEEQEITEENFEEIRTLGRRMLHSLAHVLLESVRTKQFFSTDEIKVKRDFEDQDFSLYFIDLTGTNDDFFQQFIQRQSIIQLFQTAEEILLACPCNRGSKACIQIDYCNIPDCIDNKQLNNLEHDKLNTLRLVEFLLNRNVEDVVLQLSRKIIGENTNQGVRDERNKDQIENFSRKIMEKKGGIDFRNHYYVSRFINAEEAEVYANANGITIQDFSQILYYPGLPEILIYETIFHERFHNYQFINNNFSPSLQYFNWDNIDDPQNIPYIGLLVLEGSAVWFSLRMMEYFAAIEYIQYVSRSRFLEYLTGLHLFLKIEDNKGYASTLKLLRDGFNINDYWDVFATEIQQQLAEHLNTPIQGENQGDSFIPDWLRCLKRKELLTNINRVSYYLRGQIDRNRALLGLRYYTQENRDQDVNHISVQNINYFAQLLPMTINEEDYGFSDYESVNQILSEVGLQVHHEGETELLCERCYSNCNLFMACMINGGRGVFKRILLREFPRGNRTNN